MSYRVSVRMKKRILIVEDDVRMTRILRDNFVFEGYEVACVSDGDVVLEQVKEFALDLVVLDVMLPGVSGSISPPRSGSAATRRF